MKNDLFYTQVKENNLNKPVISKFERYSRNNSDFQIYIITSPLGERYSYNYEENALLILIPSHKIIFIDLAGDEDSFEDYVEDVVQDLNSISDKYKYMEYIGRARKWKSEIVEKIVYDEKKFDINKLLRETKLQGDIARKADLLISLLTGSINDIEKIGAAQPQTMLEKVKRNIVLFDGEQTRFVFKNYAIKKVVSVQGLSGTGKTELLLHKLKELYINDETTKIFFTCHNIALADKLLQRIPRFFDFMMVNKQIKWNERLWMARAWGSKNYPDSGLYSYLCEYYDIPFLRYTHGIDYQFIYSKVMEHLESIPQKSFKPCFDYILVDESQDFPEVFFTVCKKVVRQKVYIAGDVFQDIFDTVKKKKWGVDIVLNRCYRTDPRTLMFAHAVGLGLFEENKLNWFEKGQWEELGYKTDYSEKGYLKLSRLPIRRFDDVQADHSLEIYNDTTISKVIQIIHEIQFDNPDVIPGDIAIIYIDDDREIYSYMDELANLINKEFGYLVNRGYETKSATEDAVYITNTNNVKGLEFPFVICITNKILWQYKYRNSLYTMLTRSFIKSYLLVSQNDMLDILKEGIQYINSNNSIRTHIPVGKQLDNINKNILEIKSDQAESYQDVLDSVFSELMISNIQTKENLRKALDVSTIDKFNKDMVKKFIQANLSYYQ